MHSPPASCQENGGIGTSPVSLPSHPKWTRAATISIDEYMKGSDAFSRTTGLSKKRIRAGGSGSVERRSSNDEELLRESVQAL